MRIISPYDCQAAFFSIEPHSIMALFQCKLVQQLQSPARILTQPEHARDFYAPQFDVRLLTNLHIKLAIGTKGLLFGSWNFSVANYNYDTAPTSMIDLVTLVEPDEPFYRELTTLFEHYWNMGRVRPIERAIAVAQIGKIARSE